LFFVVVVVVVECRTGIIAYHSGINDPQGGVCKNLNMEKTESVAGILGFMGRISDDPRS
jgi:hypothetical protein